MYIFIDESGDLGFYKKSVGSSRFFVVSAIKISDPKYLKRVIKKHRNRSLKKKQIEKSEIKFSNTSHENRKRILEDISKISSLEVFTVLIDKSNAYEYVKNNSPITIHSYLLKILMEKCCNKEIDQDLSVVIDRTFSRSQQELLEIYLKTQNIHILKSKYNIKILQEDSKRDHGIMCIDFIAGAIFTKYERNDEKYYSIIKSNIVSERKIF